MSDTSLFLISVLVLCCAGIKGVLNLKNQSDAGIYGSGNSNFSWPGHSNNFWEGSGRRAALKPEAPGYRNPGAEPGFPGYLVNPAQPGNPEDPADPAYLTGYQIGNPGDPFQPDQSDAGIYGSGYGRRAALEPEAFGYRYPGGYGGYAFGYHPGYAYRYNPGYAYGYHPGYAVGYHPGSAFGYHAVGYHPGSAFGYHAGSPGFSGGPGSSGFAGGPGSPGAVGDGAYIGGEQTAYLTGGHSGGEDKSIFGGNNTGVVGQQIVYGRQQQQNNYGVAVPPKKPGEESWFKDCLIIYMFPNAPNAPGGPGIPKVVAFKGSSGFPGAVGDATYISGGEDKSIFGGNNSGVVQQQHNYYGGTESPPTTDAPPPTTSAAATTAAAKSTNINITGYQRTPGFLSFAGFFGHPRAPGFPVHPGAPGYQGYIAQPVHYPSIYPGFSVRRLRREDSSVRQLLREDIPTFQERDSEKTLDVGVLSNVSRKQPTETQLQFASQRGMLPLPLKRSNYLPQYWGNSYRL